MNNKNKYRIREYNGIFTIEIAVTVIRFINWWFREVEEWHETDFDGDECYRYYNYSPTFNSIDQAKIQLKIWQTRKEAKTIYHYL